MNTLFRVDERQMINSPDKGINFVWCLKDSKSLAIAHVLNAPMNCHTGLGLLVKRATV